MSANVSFVSLDGVSFHTEENTNLWKYIVKHNIVDEKELAVSAQECWDLMDLFLEFSLDKTILKLGLYYPQLIREFIVKLSIDFDDPTSLQFQKVYIRRHQFVISLATINQFLQRNTPENVIEQRPSLQELVLEFSGGTLSSWPKNGQLPMTVLSVKYALLPRIGITNWYLSSHRSGLSVYLATLIIRLEPSLHLTLVCLS